MRSAHVLALIVPTAACQQLLGLHDLPADAPRPGDAHDAPADMRMADAPPSPFVFRQGISGVNSNSSTIAVALTSAQLAGDMNVVAIGWAGNTATLAAVSDSAGNTYLEALAVANNGNLFQTIFISCGIRGAASNTITASFAGGTTTALDIRVAEYSGTSTSACVDTGTSNFGNNTTMSVGPIATSRAPELLVAAAAVASSGTVGDPAYQTRIVTIFGDLLEDRTASATGSYSATATQNGNGGWVMQLVAFNSGP